MAAYVSAVLVVAAALTVLLAPASDARASVIEAEQMTSTQGYGATIRGDRRASGGHLLLVDSDVSVRVDAELRWPATRLQLRAHTDRGVDPGAIVTILLDGVALRTVEVRSSSWQWYSLRVSAAAGTHELTVIFLNARARNLYLDVARFSGGRGDGPTDATPGATPSDRATTPAPTVPPTMPPTAPPTATRSVPVTATQSPSAPAGAEVVLRAYVTGYSWFDNTPPGSADIAFPVLHEQAGGSGTYADPLTVAVGHTITGQSDTPDWPAGTRFYIPNLRRYFIVEDACGDGGTPQNGPCHTGYPSPATIWLDVWVGGQGGSNGGADACMDSITAVWTAIVNPATDYVVVAGDIYDGSCTAQYGDSAIRS